MQEKERGWKYTHINRYGKTPLDEKIEKIQETRQD